MKDAFEMLTIATQVTTVIALIAFVASLFVFAYRSRLKNDLEIVKSADSPEKIRAIRSLQGVVFDIDSGKLSGSQTLSLAKAQLAASSSKATKLALALVVLALILSATAILLNRQGGKTPVPTLSDLRFFLNGHAPDQEVERLVSGWGPPFRVLQPGPIRDPSTSPDEAISAEADGEAPMTPLYKTVETNEYSISIYDVEGAADLYVVRIRGAISAIGVGIRKPLALALPGLRRDPGLTGFGDASLADFEVDDCTKLTDFTGFYDIGFFNRYLVQNYDPVLIKDCVFGRSGGGFGYEHHAIFDFDETCVNQNDLVGQPFTVLTEPRNLCGDEEAPNSAAAPVAVILYTGLLHPDHNDLGFHLAGVISLIVGGIAVERAA